MGKKKKKAAHAAKAEHALVGAIAEATRHPPVALLGKASEVADQPPLIALSLVTIATGAVLRRRDIARAGTRMLLAHAIATAGKAALKQSFDRARPSRALADGQAKVGSGRGDANTDFNSFPSGHTAGAVSVAQAVAHSVPSLATSARGGAAAVAAIQLPRGAHYPTDVAIGAAIGWIAERIAGTIVEAGERAFDRHFAAGSESDALAEAEAHPS